MQVVLDDYVSGASFATDLVNTSPECGWRLVTRCQTPRRFTIYWTNMDSRRMRSPTDAGRPAVNLRTFRGSERKFVRFSMLRLPAN